MLVIQTMIELVICITKCRNWFIAFVYFVGTVYTIYKVYAHGSERTKRTYHSEFICEMHYLKRLDTYRLEYIMLLNLPIILSSNSILPIIPILYSYFYSFLFSFILPIGQQSSSLQLQIHTQLHCIHVLAWKLYYSYT